MIAAVLLAACTAIVPHEGMIVRDRVEKIEFNFYGSRARCRQIIFWQHDTVIDWRPWYEETIPANPLIFCDGGIWRHVEATLAIETITPDVDREVENRTRVPLHLRRKLSKPKTTPSTRALPAARN